jgi:hypothetical protein
MRIAEAGRDAPFMVTEWGTTGHWEVDRTDWDVAIEQTSAEKAKTLIKRYNIAIKVNTDKCLGSFVFFWGQKQERTPTWYGLFLEGGEETEMTDAIHYLWTGNWPDQRAPVMENFTINGITAHQNVKVQPGAKLKANDQVSGDTVHTVYRWELLFESIDLKIGGDREARSESLLLKEGDNVLKFNAPKEAGAYRLFVYVINQYNNAATANIPICVFHD